MKTRAALLAVAVSGLAAVVGAHAEAPQKPKAPAAVAPAPAASPAVLVYYFYATVGAMA
jgi:hypothetical protein